MKVTLREPIVVNFRAIPDIPTLIEIIWKKIRDWLSLFFELFTPKTKTRNTSVPFDAIQEGDRTLHPSKLSHNGINHCWINAPLFAVLGHEFTLNVYKPQNPECKAFLGALKRWRDTPVWNPATVYDEAYNLVVRASDSHVGEFPKNEQANDPSVFLNAVFRALWDQKDPRHDFMETLSVDSELGGGGLGGGGGGGDGGGEGGGGEGGGGGGGGEGSLALENLVRVHDGREYRRVLISFVLSAVSRAIDLQMPGYIADFYHWIAFVKVNSKQWKMWDALPQTLTYIDQHDIERGYLQNIPTGHVKQMIGIYVNREYLQQQQPELWAAFDGDNMTFQRELVV